MCTYKPEDFGAKADGITNDAYALWQTIDAAKNGGTVYLQKNKKYYIAPLDSECRSEFVTSCEFPLNGYPAAINLDGVNNLVIEGNNSTILLERPLFYCNINNTQNVTLKGLNFDYHTRPFAGATLISLYETEHAAVFKTDRSLKVDCKTIVNGFGVLQRPDGRYHMHMDTIEPIDIEQFIYKIVFTKDEVTLSRLSMLKDYLLITPIPGFAHQIERAFSITCNKNFTMQDCNVYSMARFGFALFCNEGTVKFQHVSVRKAPDETVDIVGWRDCFHVKENHAKFIWDNCYAEFCYDDIFNISASTLNVNKVINSDDLDLGWQETKGVYPSVRPGDVFSFFDYDTGRDFGEAVVSKIICQKGCHNRFRFNHLIKDIRSGFNVKAHDLSMVAPGSEIINCDFRGTFRFRGPIEIKDSHFYVARCWIDLCMPVEGPVPKNIHFENCDIDCDDSTNPYFHVLAQKSSNTEDPQYHLDDITFKNCRLPRATFEIGKFDEKYVKFD